MKTLQDPEAAETVQTTDSPAVVQERLVRPLPAGSQIEYCDIRARVIRDDGGSTLEVEIPGEGRMSWYWKFQGEECKIIQPNDESIHPESKPTDDEQESGKGLGGTHCSASFVPTLPTEFGYYWVTKKPGEKPVMLHLCPSKQFRHDERSVEAWDCPGIGRSRLDILNMPRWMWVQVLPPNSALSNYPATPNPDELQCERLTGTRRQTPITIAKPGGRKLGSLLENFLP